MKIDRTEDDSDGVVNTSALVDIMFILIIFFLVTTSFAKMERDISVNLPETDTTLSSAVKVVVINIHKDGSYFIGEKHVDLETLRIELINAIEQNPHQKVLIRGDQKALHGQVAAALSTCKSAGVFEANIGYMVTGE